MRRHGGRERMRRPRAGFASLPPGGPGQPSVPTTRDCPHGLDAARTKAGESLPDRGPGSGPVRVRKLRPRGQKSRDGAPIGAHPQPEGARAARRGLNKDAPLGAPSPRIMRGGRKGTTAYPAPPRIRAMTLGCLKIWNRVTRCHCMQVFPARATASPMAVILPLVEAAEQLPARGSLIGLDLGTKTIGVASSDPDRKLATGVETIARTKF